MLSLWEFTKPFQWTLIWFYITEAENKKKINYCFPNIHPINIQQRSVNAPQNVKIE